MDSGAYYPIGGASEIAFNMIPIIEASGGKVLVKAEVVQILINQSGKACGVTVKKGENTYEIFAPMVISNAGMDNTFKKLLPKNIAEKSYYSNILKGILIHKCLVSISQCGNITIYCHFSDFT